MTKPRIGGTFAPPLTDERIAQYKTLTEALEPSALKDALASLLRCCELWWELPEPESTAQWRHASGKGTVVSLQADHASALDEYIPWAHELEAIQRLFDAIDPRKQTELRNAAFHLLWHVKELDLGREPLTSDRL